MRRALVLSVAGFSLVVGSFHAPCAAQQAPPQYGIKFDDPPIGSNIRRYAVLPLSIPINRTYTELTAAERAGLHAWWEQIADGDEPPFPVDGLKPLFDAMRQAQQKLLVTGELFLIASVQEDGKVAEVKAIGSPSPQMTRFAATVLAVTKFKPAVCSGRPCRMDFPVRYQFRVE